MKRAEPFLVALVLVGLHIPSAMPGEPGDALQATKDWLARVDKFNSAVDRFDGNCEPLALPLQNLILVQRKMQAMALRGQQLSASDKQKLRVDVQAVMMQFTQNLNIAATVCGNDPDFSKVMKQL